MAKLKATERNAMPAKKFALPAERKYPVPDKSHAANAKARATQQEDAGNISSSTKAKIDAAANKVLHKGGSVHSDSSGSHGMHGDGVGHWSKH